MYRCLTVLLIGLIALSSCKKEASRAAPEIGGFSDSVSLVIDGKVYSCNVKTPEGAGNRQINIKPSTTLISGQDWEYQTGGYYWYGERDSTLYDAFFSFQSNAAIIKFSFSKKFVNTALNRKINVLVPADNSDIFKPGKQTFAVDLNKENTTEGVSIEALLTDKPEELTTYIPGFSIMLKSGLTHQLQDNSAFEITKVEKIYNELYLVEARFAVNLYDKHGTLYRVENGFLRFKTRMSVLY